MQVLWDIISVLLMRPLNLEWTKNFHIIHPEVYDVFLALKVIFFSSTGIYQVSVIGISYFYL